MDSELVSGRQSPRQAPRTSCSDAAKHSSFGRLTLTRRVSNGVNEYGALAWSRNYTLRLGSIFHRLRPVSRGCGETDMRSKRNIKDSRCGLVQGVLMTAPPQAFVRRRLD